MAEAPGSDVFVSYKREERERIVPLVSRLRALQLRVWFDAELRAGTLFDEEILSELSAAKAHIVCWTRTSVDSRWIRSEASITESRRIMVPIFLEKCQPKPPFNIDHTEDLSDWTGEGSHHGWQKVLKRIGELTGRGEALCRHEALGPAPGLSSLKLFIADFPDDALTQECRQKAYLFTVAEAQRHARAELGLPDDEVEDESSPTLRRQFEDSQSRLSEERTHYRSEISKLSGQLCECAGALETAKLESARLNSELHAALTNSDEQRTKSDSDFNSLVAQLSDRTNTVTSLSRQTEQLRESNEIQAKQILALQQRVDELTSQDHHQERTAEGAEHLAPQLNRRGATLTETAVTSRPSASR